MSAFEGSAMQEQLERQAEERKRQEAAEAKRREYGVAQAAPAKAESKPKFGMTIRTAKPGLLLLADGTMVMKTEYGDNEGRLDVFLVDSGERYWGKECGGLDALCWDVTEACIEAAQGAMGIGGGE